MVSGVYSDDAATQWEATTQFRKLLSIGMSAIRCPSCTCVLREPADCSRMVTCAEVWFE